MFVCMFVGHYGVAFVLKKKFKDIPLWLMFVSVQFVDLLAFILIILGIERMSYASNENPYFRSVLEYLPFSHSLFTNVIIAFIILLAFWKFKSRIWGLVLSFGVLSHWFIDLIFQDSNLPLFFNSYKVGFGLWHYPMISFGLEIIFLIAAGLYVYRGAKNYKISVLIILLMVGFFSFITFAPEPEIVQMKSEIKSLAILIPYLIFTFLSYLTTAPTAPSWVTPTVPTIRSTRR